MTGVTPSGPGHSPKGGAASSTASPAKPSVPNAWTPGPWNAERDLPYNRMPRVHGGDHSLICEVGNMGTTQDQWEANAALIAAAPELYEALAETVAARDAWLETDDDTNAALSALARMGRASDRARTVLAKARIEQVQS